MLFRPYKKRSKVNFLFLVRGRHFVFRLKVITDVKIHYIYIILRFTRCAGLNTI